MSQSIHDQSSGGSQTVAPVPSGIWPTLAAAVRGTPIDFTTAPVGRAVIMLSVPMVIEMAMESIFAVADVFWVSHLGADAVATVGLTESMMTLIYTAAMGLSIGATALVARRIGERNPDGAAHVAGQSVVLGLVISAAIAVIAAPNAPRLLRVMGATDSVVDSGNGFTRVMLGGNATVLLLFLLNAVFRGAGDAAIAMRVLWLANIINIILGPLLIFGVGPLPRLGVTGAAIATTIGRSVGAIYAVVRLFRQASRVPVRPRHLRFDLGVMRQIVGLSGSATLQNLIGMASWIGLVRILAGFGSDALAGYTIAVRIIIFALLPSWGLSNAAATMVGQSLGAKKPDRAESSVWRAGRYNAYVLSGVGLVFFLGAPLILRAFTSDPTVTDYAVHCLRIVALGFPLYAYGMVLTQSFNGAGDTWTPTWLNLSCFWIFEIPVAWTLAHHVGLGPSGVFWAIMAAFSLLALASAWVFRRGKWKTRVV
jgi:putative MATE family efflux protein